MGITQATSDLTNTIVQGLGNWANSYPQQAMMERQFKQDAAQEARQKEAADRAKQEFEWANAYRKQPVTWGSLASAPEDLPHLAARTSDGKIFGEGLLEAAGGYLDKNPESPTYNQPMHKSGRRLIHQDFIDNKDAVRSYYHQHTDGIKKARDKMNQAARVMRNTDPSSPKYAKAKQAYERLKQFSESPEEQIKQIDNQLNLLQESPIQNAGIEKDIERLRADKKNIQDQMEKEKDRALERELADKRIRAERAKGRGDKDLRGPFGKLVDDYLRIGKFIDPKNYTLADAKREAEAYQNDPRVSSALQQMLTAIDNSYDMSPADQKALKKEIYSGLKEIANRHAGPKEEEPKGRREPPPGFVRQ